MSSKNKRILLLNPFGIGDVLFSTPLVETLKNNFPDSFIGYLCNKRTQDLLETNPAIDKTFLFERGYYKRIWSVSKYHAFKSFYSLLGQIKAYKFDMVFDMSMRHESGLYTFFMGIKKRIGFDYKKRGLFLTKKIKIDAFHNKPVAEYYLDLARKIGVKKLDHNLHLHLTKDDIAFADKFFLDNNLGIKKTVCVVPGGGASYGKSKLHFKRWKSSKFADLSNVLIEYLNASVIIIGSREEKLLFDEISEKTGHRVTLIPFTSIRKVAAVMKKSDLVVCNDGGPLHVAVSQGVKTVSIFGPTDDNVYGPYPPSPRHTVIKNNGIPCAPCYKKFKLPDCNNQRCLEEITAEQIIKTIEEKLR